MKESIELVNKYGINAVLFIALFWMNSRLSDVESRLYNCYDKLTISEAIPIKKHHHFKIEAVLPDKLKIVEEA